MGYHWSPCPTRKSIPIFLIIGVLIVGWIGGNGKVASHAMIELLIWIIAVFGSAILLAIVGSIIFVTRGMRMYKSAHVTCQCAQCISRTETVTVNRSQTTGEIAAAPDIDFSEDYIRSAINKKVK